jgi:hypothetical protein
VSGAVDGKPSGAELAGRAKAAGVRVPLTVMNKIHFNEARKPISTPPAQPGLGSTQIQLMD